MCQLVIFRPVSRHRELYRCCKRYANRTDLTATVSFSSAWVRVHQRHYSCDESVYRLGFKTHNLQVLDWGTCSCLYMLGGGGGNAAGLLFSVAQMLFEKTCISFNGILTRMWISDAWTVTIDTRISCFYLLGVNYNLLPQLHIPVTYQAQ
jgi:hypothetical protein